MVKAEGLIPVTERIPTSRINASLLIKRSSTQVNKTSQSTVENKVKTSWCCKEV
jgi:hypothetical protein